MNQAATDAYSFAEPDSFHEYMNSVLSRLSDEQITLIKNAIRRELKKNVEESITKGYNLDDTTWRAKDLLQRVENKETLYRVDRTIICNYLKKHFITPLSELANDLKNDPKNLAHLAARIQTYIDIIALLKQKMPKSIT